MGKVRRLVALRQGSALYYVVPDHLGDTVCTVDTLGNLVDDIRYHAFGATRSGGTNTPTDKRFTGETLDASSGLYCLGARYYDPALGRFISPDPIIPNPRNPQSVNRYSYALNNPLRYVDPTGYDEDDPVDGEPPEETGGQEGSPEDSDLSWSGGSGEAGGEGDLPSSDAAMFGAPPDPSGIPPDGGIPSPEAAPDPAPDPEPPVPAVVVPETDSPAPMQPEVKGPYVDFQAGVIVVNNAPGIVGDIIKAVGGGQDNTITVSQALILSSTEASPNVELMRHEMGHVQQAAILGPLYLPAYLGAWAATALQRRTLDPQEIHRFNPMEVDANGRGGLPPDWGSS